MAERDADGSTPLTTGVAELVFGEGVDRVCRDIPDAACREHPRNLTVHLASLTATKTGDGLVDPKLVLSWLVTALGGSALAVGMIVPLRESLALLPQLALGYRVRRLPRRAWVWGAASAGQGMAVLGIGGVALAAEGTAAAWAIVALVAVLAAARSAASVSYKDVLGKTVAKSRRGTLTGTATSISAALVLAFGAALATGLIPLTTTAVGVVLLAAGSLWLIAAALFRLVVEEPGSTDGGVDGVRTALDSLSVLRRDRQLARFVAVRSLLTVTAVAPPYLLASTADGGRAIDSLGSFVIASSIATIVGGRLWGTLSDRSSRRVLVGAATAATVLFVVAASGSWFAPDILARELVAAVLLFLVVLAYQGVRLGRATHLVDMADADTRSVYTAVSNTVVGAVILATAGFGWISESAGLTWVFVMFATASAAAVVVAIGLDEVQ